LKIFFSYGHDKYSHLVKKIKEDLQLRYNLYIWFDSEELKAQYDWEHTIENAISESQKIIYFITKYSARRPDGYCLNELAFSIVNKKEIIPIMLEYITPPLSICRLQYLDAQHLIKKYDKKEYDAFLQNIYELIKGEKQISYEGNHFNLVKVLNPIDFNTDFQKHLNNFVGREWLYNEVSTLLEDQDNRLIWIQAKAGFGKTAFATILQYKHERAVGIHYCQFNSARRKNPLSVIKTLMFQLSTQINQYREFLLNVDLQDLQNKTYDEIIELYLLEPLQNIEYENSFFIIDAIDEAVDSNNNNKLVDIICKFNELPSWLKIVITSRPEPYLQRKLSFIPTLTIKSSFKQNNQDLNLFLDFVADKQNLPILKEKQIKHRLITNSEGNILYLKEIVEEISKNSLTSTEILHLPKGMDALYINMFERYFPDLENYKKYQRPLFELMSATNKKISRDFLMFILQWDEYMVEEALEPIGSLIEEIDEKLVFYHKSIVDWMTNKQKSGKNFFISKQHGLERIVNKLSKTNINSLQKRKNNSDDMLIIFYAFYTLINLEITRNPSKASSLYNKIITIKEKLFKETNLRDYLEKHIHEGNLNFILNLTLQDYKITKVLKEINEKYHYYYLLAGKNYAFALYELGSIQEAITIQKDITSEMKKLLENSETSMVYSYIQNLNFLSELYSSIGNLKESIETDIESLDYIQLSKNNKNKLIWDKLQITILNTLMKSYGNFGSIKEAIQVGERAKEILTPYYEQEPQLWIENYIQTGVNLAVSYKDIGDFQKAILLEDKLLTLTQKLYEKEEKYLNDYALVLNNLAFSYKSIGRINSAIKLEQIALHITKSQYYKVKGYWTHLYIKSLLNLALSYKNIWELDKAIKLESKAITLTKAFYKRDKLRWADVYTRTLTSLGISYYKKGFLEKSLRLEEKSLSIRESLYKKNKQRWIDAYTLSIHNSAVSYYTKKEYQRTYILLKKNLLIRKQFYKNNPQRWKGHYSESLINFALFHLLENTSTQKIQKYLYTAVNIQYKNYKSNQLLWRENFSKCLHSYSFYLWKNGKDQEQALYYEKESFKIRKQLYIEHPKRWLHFYLYSLSSLMFSYLYKKEEKKATQLYDILESILIQEHPGDLHIWLKTHFADILFLDLNALMQEKEKLFNYKANILRLEYLEKKSPHRWSDAFK